MKTSTPRKTSVTCNAKHEVCQAVVAAKRTTPGPRPRRVCLEDFVSCRTHSNSEKNEATHTLVLSLRRLDESPRWRLNGQCSRTRETKRRTGQETHPCPDVRPAPPRRLCAGPLPRIEFKSHNHKQQCRRYIMKPGQATTGHIGPGSRPSNRVFAARTLIS